MELFCKFRVIFPSHASCLMPLWRMLVNSIPIPFHPHQCCAQQVTSLFPFPPPSSPGICVLGVFKRILHKLYFIFIGNFSSHLVNCNLLSNCIDLMMESMFSFAFKNFCLRFKLCAQKTLSVKILRISWDFDCRKFFQLLYFLPISFEIHGRNPYK